MRWPSQRRRSPRQLLVFVAGSAGRAGSLAVPFVGFPLAIYGGWTVLAVRAEGGALATAIAPRAVTAVLIVFRLPALLAGQACAS